MRQASRRFTEVSFCASFQNAAYMSELFIYTRGFLVKHFPHLLYQTRYGAICFACFGLGSRSGDAEFNAT